MFKSLQLHSEGWAESEEIKREDVQYGERKGIEEKALWFQGLQIIKQMKKT